MTGLENAPQAFLGLFGGENFGKLVVQVSETCPIAVLSSQPPLQTVAARDYRENRVVTAG